MINLKASFSKGRAALFICLIERGERKDWESAAEQGAQRTQSLSTTAINYHCQDDLSLVFTLIRWICLMPAADKTYLAMLIRPCQCEEPFLAIFILFYSSHLPKLRDSVATAKSHCACWAWWENDLEEEPFTPQSA